MEKGSAEGPDADHAVNKEDLNAERVRLLDEAPRSPAEHTHHFTADEAFAAALANDYTPPPAGMGARALSFDHAAGPHGNRTIAGSESTAISMPSQTTIIPEPPAVQPIRTAQPATGTQPSIHATRPTALQPPASLATPPGAAVPAALDVPAAPKDWHMVMNAKDTRRTPAEFQSSYNKQPDALKANQGQVKDPRPAHRRPRPRCFQGRFRGEYFALALDQGERPGCPNRVEVQRRLQPLRFGSCGAWARLHWPS
mmetsp:Transcript_19251/g.56738  ORF Transcript_19251/g.56738 Transcript_19251/m.56738 type:complete len:255 (-) Transcript_19251:399-1163(-)